MQGIDNNSVTDRLWVRVPAGGIAKTSLEHAVVLTPIGLLLHEVGDEFIDRLLVCVKPQLHERLQWGGAAGLPRPVP